MADCVRKRKALTLLQKFDPWWRLPVSTDRKTSRNRPLTVSKTERVPDSFGCSQCASVFTTEETLARHLQAKHLHKGGKHRCRFCDYSSDKTYNIQKHERRHTAKKTERVPDSFSCSECKREFDTEVSLRRHSRAKHPHKGGNHQCRFCDYSSRKMNHVKDHERTHTGERPYACKVCRKKFVQKSHLVYHARTVH
ncbi:zinc finger protein 22-like [Ornithodoros turicata]|uniref:zinc finger protein 22-like n=1 Tax=Ornithodoros turicata TaxID=34597 RepID=UPI003138A2B9